LHPTFYFLAQSTVLIFHLTIKNYALAAWLSGIAAASETEDHRFESRQAVRAFVTRFPLLVCAVKFVKTKVIITQKLTVCRGLVKVEFHNKF
jgi:hypothetical protein